MQLESALPIVRALADGINPVTGELYPDHSPYAEPRALRALYSAVDLMQKEIDREKRRFTHALPPDQARRENSRPRFFVPLPCAKHIAPTPKSRRTGRDGDDLDG